MPLILLLLLSLLPSFAARAQHSTFDYSIYDVKMFEVNPANGDTHRVSDLSAYLYDIGPKPSFIFSVEIEQGEGASANAGLQVEQYMLLQPDETSVYKALDNLYPDVFYTPALTPTDILSPAWVYHSPVNISFSRKTTGEGKMVFVSTSHQMDFLDPQNPITFARPLNHTILGFAYRFVLISTSVHQRDIKPADNVFQLTFLKP